MLGRVDLPRVWIGGRWEPPPTGVPERVTLVTGVPGRADRHEPPRQAWRGQRRPEAHQVIAASDG